MALSYTDAVLIYEDGQVQFEEGFFDIDFPMTRAFGRGVSKLASGGYKLTKAVLGQVWHAFLGSLDGFLNRLSGAEFINMVDEPESIADLLAQDKRHLEKLAREKNLPMVYKGFEWVIDDWVARLTEKLLVEAPQKFGDKAAAWLAENPEYATAMAVHGAIAAYVGIGGGGVLGATVYAGIAASILLVQAGIRIVQGDKPMRVKKTWLGVDDTRRGGGHIEEIPESIYRWTDTGDPLDEGVLQNLLSGATSAFKFDPTRVRAWLAEKKRAAEAGEEPRIDTVEGLSAEVLKTYQALPDELERLGVDTNSRAFKFGMASTRVVASILNVLIAPFWGLIKNVFEGIDELEQRYTTLPIRVAFALMLLLPVGGFAIGSAAPAIDILGLSAGVADPIGGLGVGLTAGVFAALVGGGYQLMHGLAMEFAGPSARPKKEPTA